VSSVYDPAASHAKVPEVTTGASAVVVNVKPEIGHNGAATPLFKETH
jgi:hypothetical protein